MSDELSRISSEVERNILAGDVAVLNALPASEHVFSLMVAEHAARIQTLARMIDPEMARPLLVMIAQAITNEARQVSAQEG